MIAIIDYNVGNVGSIENMLKKIGHKAIVTSDISLLSKAEKLVLPGVGSFDYGMQNLKTMGIIDLLHNRVINEGIPLLGICLGMQLLTKKSEEGILPGLGFFEARSVRFPSEWNGNKINTPHIGWNYVKENSHSLLFKNAYEGNRFYFVHSYYVECMDQSDIIGTTEYAGSFTSAIGKGKIFGVQFHPEKSHKYGMQLLKNFAELV